MSRLANPGAPSGAPGWGRRAGRRLSAGAALLLALLAALYVAPPAVAYPVSSGSLSVTSTTSLAPGHSVGLSGGGYQPGASVSIDVFSRVTHLGSVSADGSGVISTAVTIPSGLSAGQHTLQATGPAPAGGTRVLSITFTVAGGLPRTGTSAITLWAVGLLALAVGFSLLLLARLRRPGVPEPEDGPTSAG